MEILCRKTEKAVLIALKGNLDTMTSPEFDKRIAELTGAGEAFLIVDLTNLAYISSAGLRSLLSAAKKVKAQSGNIVLFGLQDSVKEVFDITGFNNFFLVADNEPKALELI